MPYWQKTNKYKKAQNVLVVIHLKRWPWQKIYTLINILVVISSQVSSYKYINKIGHVYVTMMVSYDIIQLTKANDFHDISIIS